MFCESQCFGHGGYRGKGSEGLKKYKLKILLLEHENVRISD
jgi:hypothetical protein